MENPHSHAPICEQAKPSAPTGPGLPIELASVLMVMKGKGPGHHLIQMLGSVDEDDTGKELRK